MAIATVAPDGTDAATQLRAKLLAQAQGTVPATDPSAPASGQADTSAPAQFATPQAAPAPVSTTEPVAKTTGTTTQTTAPVYTQVATAPDNVPVYSSGGNYYTQNADKSYTQQFQGGLPDWLSSAVNGTPSAPSGTATPAAGSDVTQALTQLYQSLGTAPTGPGTGPTDLAYFAQRINQTGGMTPQNISYWFGPTGRIAQELKGTVSPEVAAGTPANTGTATSAGTLGNDSVGTNTDTDFNTYLKTLTDQTAATQAQRDQVRAILMQHLQDASTPVNESDANIAAPLSAARDEAQRAQDAERTALAEHMYAAGNGGLQSNQLTQAIQQSAERNAGGLSSLRAGLVSQAYQQKAATLQQDLQLALAQGDTQTAQQLQAEIAALGAQVSREGLGINLSEFLAQLNQNTALAGAG